MSQTKPNNSFKTSLIYVNALFLSFVLFLIFFITPHFDGHFFQWKVILNLSDGLTHEYHHFNDLVGWQYIYEALYLFSTNVPWFTIITLLLVYLSSAVIVSILWILGLQLQVNRTILISVLLIIAGVLSCNIVWIHHNRAGFLVVGASLLSTFFMLKTDVVSGKNRYFFYILSFLTFVAGLCIRPEAGLAAFVLSLFAILLIQHKIWIKTLLHFVPHIIILSLFFGFYLFQVSNNDSFYYQLEPDVEYELMDRRNTIEKSTLLSSKDHARYKAVTSWMLGDVKTNPPSFIRSLINKDSSLKTSVLFFTLKPNPAKVERIINSLKSLIYNNVFLFCILLLMAVSGLFIKQAGFTFKIFLFSLFTVLVIGSSFSVNAYDRVIQPMLALSTVWVIVMVLFSYKSKEDFIVLPSFLLLIAALFVIQTVYWQNQKSTELLANESSIRKKINIITQEAKDREYVIVMEDFYAANTGAFSPFNYFEDKTVIIPSYGQFSGNPNLLKTNAKHTGCEELDFLCRMQFIEEHKGNAIIFSTKRRLEVYKTYLQDYYEYNLDLPIEEADILFENSVYWLLD